FDKLHKTRLSVWPKELGDENRRRLESGIDFKQKRETENIPGKLQTYLNYQKRPQGSLRFSTKAFLSKATIAF
ncbi:MAG: hypothetical protein K9M57_06795, partial [Phycisphaerae bacterium]|nr:hypothetical protein [Phycisphaerae bacterium]